MKSIRKAVLGLMAVFGLFGIAACGETVMPGHVGIKVKAFGSGAGVQNDALPPGFHWTGIGEDIINYPVIQRTYSYTREPNNDGQENEEINFSDNNALPMTADVQMVVRVRKEAAPNLYQQFRLNFNELLDGPIRNDVRTAIAKESELVTVEYLYKGGRQEMIRKALVPVAKKWAAMGVEITQLDWVGPIRYPDVILAAIQSKTKAEADTQAARAQVEVAKAEAATAIEQARGTAESNKLIAESIRQNPEIVTLKAVERWNGQMPTYWGGNALPFLNIK